MINTLVFPLTHFQSLLRTFAAAPNNIVLCPVGINRLASETRFLVRGIESVRDQPVSAGDRRHSICVSTTADTASPTVDFLESARLSGAVAHLVIGRGPAQGRLWGAITNPSGTAEALHRILLVGAGMHELMVSSLPSSPVEAGGKSSISIRRACQRWARTIGALGARNWRRLVSLRIAIVGCGRSGSIAAVTLARLGVRSLILIDPDFVEEHNLAEMEGVNNADVGRLKVEALADFLQDNCAPANAPLDITTIPEPITTAQRAVFSADVLFCCVDNDAARLACGILATLFHKVLIDIGTGVFRHAPTGDLRGCEGTPSASRLSSLATRMMGADVRLILPADGCLLCFGSVANFDGAIDVLCRGIPLPENRGEPWWVRRTGSLRCLNMLAVSLGIHLLCELSAERVQNSRWARLEFDEDGRLSVQHFARSGSQETLRCPLCAKSGLGDDGLMWCNQSVNSEDKDIVR